MNIFELQQSAQDKEFVLKNGSLEFEVFADILNTAGDLPYIGSLFKLGKVAVNYMDYRFVRKLHFFLAQSELVEPEKKKSFLIVCLNQIIKELAAISLNCSILLKRTQKRL